MGMLGGRNGKISEKDRASKSRRRSKMGKRPRADAIRTPLAGDLEEPTSPL